MARMGLGVFLGTLYLRFLHFHKHAKALHLNILRQNLLRTLKVCGLYYETHKTRILS
jgi:hypothetical protein